MGSFAQICLGVLILGAAFIFGQQVHQQNQAAEQAQAALAGTADTETSDQALADTSWQNRTGKSLFELNAPPTTSQSMAPQTRPLVPFSRGPANGNSTNIPQAQIPDAQRFSRMPNSLSGVPGQANTFSQQPPRAPDLRSSNNSSESIFAPLANQGRSEYTGDQSGEIPVVGQSSNVPLIEPDFSNVVRERNTPLEYLSDSNTPAGSQFDRTFSGDTTERPDSSLLKLQANRQPFQDRPNSISGTRPAAPEFTIYPDADRPSDIEIQANGNPAESLVANNSLRETDQRGLQSDERGDTSMFPRSGISPIADPLTRPLPPTPRESLSGQPGMRDAPRVGDQSIMDRGDEISGNIRNEKSWLDEFNQPFNASPEPDRVTRLPQSVVDITPRRDDTLAPQSALPPRQILQSPVPRSSRPQRDNLTNPRIADSSTANSSMLPFGMNEQAKSRLVEVTSRQTAMKLSTNQFVRHQTVAGDTLQKLATEYFGSADFYLDIYVANQDQLGNPADVPAGITLRIPVYE